MHISLIIGKHILSLTIGMHIISLIIGMHNICAHWIGRGRGRGRLPVTPVVARDLTFCGHHQKTACLENLPLK